MDKIKKNSEEYMIGRRFCRLVVIGESEKKIKRNGFYDDRWICKCDCGNVKTISGHGLRYGSTKSCGCLGKERGEENLRIARKTIFTKHNQFGTRLYNIWGNMNYRCNCKNATQYQRYGGRGIKVCDEWQDFQNFYEWAMKNGYTDELSIDRIDVNGNYEPSNCRWVTWKEQANNRRNTRYLTYNGETKCVKDWEIETGINSVIIKNRIDRLGWSVERALTEKVREKRSV